MPAFFFLKKIAFFVQKSTFTPSNSVKGMFSFFATQKSTVNENINFPDSVSGIQPPDLSKLAKNPKNDNDVTTFRHYVIVNFSDVVLFLLSSLVNGLSFMSISSLVLELWLFSFIRDEPEIRKSEILPSEFFSISGDWDELWICSTECKYAFEK